MEHFGGWLRSSVQKSSVKLSTSTRVSAERRRRTSSSRRKTASNRLMTQSADLKIAGKALSSYFPSTSVSNPEALRESTREAFPVRADAGVDDDVGRIDSSGSRLMVHGKGTLCFFFFAWV